jgi:pilus assembly protein CpaE
MINCAMIAADETLQRHVMALVHRPENSMRLVLELREDAADLSRERVAQILSAEPRIVFIDLGDSMTGLRVVDLLSQEAPGIAIIAAGPVVEADTLLRVMRAGAAEYLPRPFRAEEVNEAFQRVRRRFGVVRQEEPAAKGTVTAVFSPKGGVGVTTVAVNLAVSLQRLTRQNTLLIDLAPSLGTAALTMGLQPRYSYLDVIQNFHRLDEELVRSFLEVHESGVQVLASPTRADDPSGPSMDQVMAVLRLCRRYFGHIVIDAGHTLTSAVDTAFIEATHRILVATPELPTLRNLKRALELLGEHNVNGTRPWRVVLNQHMEDVGLSLRDVENALGLQVGTVIEREETLITESINLGRPALLSGRSPFARSIVQLGRELAGADKVVVARAGLLETFLRPFRPAQGPAAVGGN